MSEMGIEELIVWQLRHIEAADLTHPDGQASYHAADQTITILERVKRLEEDISKPEFARGCLQSMQCTERRELSDKVLRFLKTGE